MQSSGFIAEKLKLIKPSATLAVTAKAAELRAAGKDVIGLGAGEPDFNTPENIANAGILAIQDGQTRYTAVPGLPRLKEAVCDKLKRENSIQYESSEIIVGTGAKQVLFNALFATLNPGDEVIIPAPYWVSYPDMTLLAGGTPVIVPCGKKEGFKLKPEQLEKAITDKTKWVIINSPSNPTGAVYTKEELQAIAEVLLPHKNVHVLSDDIYEHIIYDDHKFYTMAQVAPALKDRVLTVNGVSKGYAMTGWRIGYGAGHPELIKAMSKIQSQSTSSASTISQFAALEALMGPQDSTKKNAEIFKKRRDLTVELLRSIQGIDCIKPSGAFYIFASCQELIGKKTKQGNMIQDDIEFAQYLVRRCTSCCGSRICIWYA